MKPSRLIFIMLCCASQALKAEDAVPAEALLREPAGIPREEPGVPVDPERSAPDASLPTPDPERAQPATGEGLGRMEGVAPPPADEPEPAPGGSMMWDEVVRIAPEETPAWEGLKPHGYGMSGRALALPDLTLEIPAFQPLGGLREDFRPGIHKTLRAGVLVDDHVLGPADEPRRGARTDVILSAGLDVQADLGARRQRLRFSYSLTGFLFTRNSSLSSLNHSVGVSAVKEFRRTVLLADVNYAHLTGSDRQGGSSVEADLLGLSLGVVQGVGPRLRLRSGLSLQGRSYQEAGKSSDLALSLGGDYLLGSDTRLGTQWVWGHQESESFGEDYQQWRLTLEHGRRRPLTVAGSAGWQWRDSGSGFVFDLELAWRASDRTRVMLSGSRQTLGSAFAGLGSREVTRLEAGVDHRFLGHYVAAVAFGLEQGSYARAGGGTVDDDYWYFRASLSRQFRPNLTGTLYYEHRNSDSGGAESSSFGNNRVGMSLIYTF